MSISFLCHLMVTHCKNWIERFDKTFKANNFYLKAMRTNLWDPKTKHSFAVTLLHGLSEVWAALKGMAFGVLMSEKGVFSPWLGIGYFAVYNHGSSSLMPGSGIQCRNMVGQVYFCSICFTKLNFCLIIKVDVLPCLDILFWLGGMSRDHCVKIQ